jgi:DNA-binding transcriptional LysR family regulator
MIVAVPLAHPLAACRAVDLRALRDEAFILYPRNKGHGLSEKVVTECERIGFSPIVAQQRPQMISTINLVAAAIGIAIVPDCMRHVRPDGVRYIRLTGTNITADIALAHRRQNASPLLRNILEVVGL